jgi:hypothetical protein
MNTKSLKGRFRPLRVPREVPDSLSDKEEKRLQELFEEANRSLERASSGESLREYIGRIEELARGIFTSENMSPDPIAVRCAQIVSEREDIGATVISDAAGASGMAPEGVPDPLQRGAISEFVYGAARVLLRVNMLKVTIAQPAINPWILAADCMRVEEAHQQLIGAGAFDREDRTRTARQAREEEAKERQDRMRAWINANGRFPTNDKVTRGILEYKNADKESARKLFSRDLNAVHATFKLPK